MGRYSLVGQLVGRSVSWLVGSLLFGRNLSASTVLSTGHFYLTRNKRGETFDLTRASSQTTSTTTTRITATAAATEKKKGSQWPMEERRPVLFILTFSLSLSLLLQEFETPLIFINDEAMTITTHTQFSLSLSFDQNT
jgi:hypothetical protein